MGLKVKGVMLRTTVTGACFALCGMFAVAPAHAGLPPWPMDPYVHYPQAASVHDVLTGFAQGYGMTLKATGAFSKPVRGSIDADNPSLFLDRLGAMFGFQWFTQDGVLYISRPSESETRALRVPGSGAPNLRQALTRLGVLDARFGWGELPEQNVVLVSGPPDYVGLIERTLAALPAVADTTVVEVFPLRHAFVTDRVVRYRDRTMVTPGLATTLKRLLEQDGGTEVLPSGLDDTVQTLREGLNAEETGRTEVQATVVSTRSSAVARRSIIEADPRLNALIVRDAAERMPLYRRLIERLDRPVALIHIDAMIVDVNTSRLNELGISWRGRAGRFQLQGGARALGGSADNVMSAMMGPGSLGIALGSDFAARIDAMAQDNDARIQSQASLLTVENIGAVIDLAETVYLETVGARAAVVTPVTVGTSLRVTPRALAVGDHYEVELSVDIEDGASPQGERSDKRHSVRRGSISTLAVVADAEALLIGGYTQTRRNEEQDKVPFLGDLPWIGALFRSTRSQNQQRERLFIIRPSVMAIEGRRLSVRPGFIRDGVEARKDLLDAGFQGTSLPLAPGTVRGPIDLPASSATGGRPPLPGSTPLRFPVGHQTPLTQVEP